MVFDDNIATFVCVAIQEHSVTFVILRVDFFCWVGKHPSPEIKGGKCTFILHFFVDFLNNIFRQSSEN